MVAKYTGIFLIEVLTGFMNHVFLINTVRWNNMFFCRNIVFGNVPFALRMDTFSFYKGRKCKSKSKTKLFMCWNWGKCNEDLLPGPFMNVTKWKLSELELEQSPSPSNRMPEPAIHNISFLGKENNHFIPDH